MESYFALLNTQEVSVYFIGPRVTQVAGPITSCQGQRMTTVGQAWEICLLL